MKRQEETDRERYEVFFSVGRGVGYIHLATIRSSAENLKNAYRHDNFAKVSVSLISPRSIEDRDRLEATFSG